MISASPSGHVIRHTKRTTIAARWCPGSRTLISRGENRLSRAARQTGIRLPSVIALAPVDRPGIEPGSPVRRTGVFPLDHQPVSSSVDRRGIEPRLPGCKPSVFPLDQWPASIERSVPELNRVFLLTEEVCCRNTYRPFRVSDPGWTRTITFLVVTQASLPLDHGIVFQ